MTKTKNNYLNRPSKDLINIYVKKWDENKKLVNNEKLLTNLFKEKKENIKFLDILLKSTCLNSLYSTNIFDINSMSENIYNSKIDDELKKGSYDVIEKIATVKIKEKEKRFYSFATKYCSFHFPDKYPIYDSYVDKILRCYRNQDKFFKFKNEDLKKYRSFVEIIEHFKKFYELEDFSFKDIDKFLWQFGRENFKK